jgi:hypothetical protein
LRIGFLIMENVDPIDDFIAHYSRFDPQLDPSVLQGLDAIQWSELSHAYGSAADVPALLRASLSENPDHRAIAFEILHSSICHQGTIYQATSLVIPFLIRMLTDNQTPDPLETVILLSTISRAYPHMVSYHQQHGTEIAGEDFVYAREAHMAARKGLEQYLLLVNHPLSNVRECVINLLCTFQEDYPSVLPVLYDHIRDEKNDEVQGNTINSEIVAYLLKISASRDEKSRFVDLFEKIVAREAESIMTSFPAACAIAKLTPQAISERAIAMLVYAIAHPEGIDPYSRFVPPDPKFLPPDQHKEICEDLVVAHAIDALARLNLTKSIPALFLGLQKAIKPEHAHAIATRLLCLAFLGRNCELSPAIFDVPEYKDNTIFYARLRKKEAAGDIEYRVYPVLMTQSAMDIQNPYCKWIVKEIRSNEKILAIRSNLLAAFMLSDA